MLGLSVKLLRISQGTISRTHTFNSSSFFVVVEDLFLRVCMLECVCHSAYVYGSWWTLSGVGSLILLSVLVLILYSRLTLGP